MRGTYLGSFFCLLLIAGCNGDGQASDSGSEDAFDAGTDAGTDGGQDGDRDQEPPWSWCPSASDYVGGDWPAVLRVTSGALHCATFDEGRELEEELPVKSRLRIVPGDYPVPDTDGEHPFVLPVCFEFLEPGAQPALAGDGHMRAWYNEDASGRTYHFEISMPLVTGAGQAWTFEAWLSGRELDGEAIGFIDGTYSPPFESPWFDFRLYTDSQDYRTYRHYASCHFASAQSQRHTVTFQGGEAELYLQMGESGDSTEPAAFVRAAGTLDGTGFEQTDYYRLIYNPQHHHFERDFAVLFDSPIGGACGLKFETLDPWNEDPPGRVTTLGCDLTEIEERDVTGEDWEIL